MENTEFITLINNYINKYVELGQKPNTEYSEIKNYIRDNVSKNEKSLYEDQLVEASNKAKSIITENRRLQKEEERRIKEEEKEQKRLQKEEERRIKEEEKEQKRLQKEEERRIKEEERQKAKDEKRTIIEQYYEVLTTDEDFKDKLKYNDFIKTYTFNDCVIDDSVLTSIRLKIGAKYNFDSKQIAQDAVKMVCKQHSFNPFTAQISKLKWDGETRIPKFFIKFLGCEDTKLNESLTTKWFYALIKRLYEPGCDFDNMLIVCDETQGTGKTKIIQRLVNALGLNYGYDQTIKPDSYNKDNLIKISKCAIIGVDEFATFMKKDPEQTKSFVSANFDTYRPLWESVAIDVPRHCVFYGNCNMKHFLKDYTSSFERRYWIMNANGERHNAEWWNENMPDNYLRQIWAEAKYMYDSDKNFNYTTLSEEETEELIQIQFEHKTFNSDETLIYDLEKISSAVMVGDEFKTESEFCEVMNTILDDTYYCDGGLLAQPINKLHPIWLRRLLKTRGHVIGSPQYLTSIMKSIGWDRKQAKYNGKNTKMFVR